MERKPDVIRALVVAFVIGLVVSGVTSLQASDERESTVASSVADEGVVAVPRREQ